MAFNRGRNRKTKTNGKGKLSKGQKKAVKQVVRSIVPAQEVKQCHFNALGSQVISNTTGTFETLLISDAVNWPLGVGSSQRISTEIFLKRIQFRCTTYTTGGQNTSPIRIIVYCDNEYDGTQSPLFGSAQPMFNRVAAAGFSYHYPFNTDTVVHKGHDKKFTIYYDKYHYGYDSTNNVAALTDYNFKSVRIDQHFGPIGLKILFSPVTVAGIAAVQNKQIYVAFFAGNGAITPNIYAEGVWVCDYTDA